MRRPVSPKKKVAPRFEDRPDLLEQARNRKMAQSPHRYVRGSTLQFYEWLASPEAPGMPEGPPIWICGDCHVGNLGPVANADGRIRINIRDLDQTVIGNPALDLVRLALSLASAARGSNLPGVTTAHVLEEIMAGYESTFQHDFDETGDTSELPEAVSVAMREASHRGWKQLAEERLEDAKPEIPLGKKFWPITEAERTAIFELFQSDPVRDIPTMLGSRSDDATVEVVDCAYWMKGCSSLGLLRFAVLLGVADPGSKSVEYCLFDIKEATESVAPPAANVEMPPDNAVRVVEGARRLSPFLGDRMRSATLLDRSVFIREILPQDLKLELELLTTDEALLSANYLAACVGLAHARQMDSSTRTAWEEELSRHHTQELDAPSWLWTNVLGLLVDHERSYLEHCRLYALSETP
jgi:uncharacterized protein (DUF2252 family)